MKSFKSWRWLLRRRSAQCEGGKSGFKMRQIPFIILCTVMLYIVYKTMNYQHQRTEMEERWDPFGIVEEYRLASEKLRGLPRGIMHAYSDLERRPLWGSSSSRSKVASSNRNLLAIPVGIKQKHNVNKIVQKFLSENFTIMLFHYDGNVDGWSDLHWSDEAIHIAARNQTKWWFAKRFLHPDIVYLYDYIFLWDEDLGVENFHPGRYVRIVKSEGLEISQPALHPNSTDIHHRITIRARTKKFHRRVYDIRGHTKCTNTSQGPPCTGFVEGMAPVFSRSAWFCAWHLIQNDLVHGWGMDMKLGYCAQGDRTKRVGVVDSEYIIHQGIQTLGNGRSSVKKNSDIEESSKKNGGTDIRAEIRRQSTWEHQIFKKRWNLAVRNDKEWVDPFKSEDERNYKSWWDSFKTDRRRRLIS